MNSAAHPNQARHAGEAGKVYVGPGEAGGYEQAKHDLKNFNGHKIVKVPGGIGFRACDKMGNQAHIRYYRRRKVRARLPVCNLQKYALRKTRGLGSPGKIDLV